MALRSMTKEGQVVEALEFEDRSLAIVVDSKDTTQETVPNPSQYVSIENPMNIFLKTALFYRVSGGKRDR